MKKKYMLLLMAAGILLVVNVILASVLLSRPTGQVLCPAKSKSLPCEAMPIKFALDNPDCANKLLRAMNVTNVNFFPRKPSNQLLNRTYFYSRNLSEENK